MSENPDMGHPSFVARTGAPGYMSRLFVKVALESGVRTVGVEPTSPVRSGGFKDRCVCRSTTSARGGERPKILPAIVCVENGGPRIRIMSIYLLFQ